MLCAGRSGCAKRMETKDDGKLTEAARLAGSRRSKECTSELSVLASNSRTAQGAESASAGLPRPIKSHPARHRLATFTPAIPRPEMAVLDVTCATLPIAADAHLLGTMRAVGVKCCPKVESVARALEMMETRLKTPVTSSSTWSAVAKLKKSAFRVLAMSGRFVTVTGPERYIGARKLSWPRLFGGLAHIFWRSFAIRGRSPRDCSAHKPTRHRKPDDRSDVATKWKTP